MESAYNWLRENGLDDIIKNEVSVQFGKGEDSRAQELLSLAGLNGYEPTQRQKVEPMTLMASIGSVSRPASTCLPIPLIYLYRMKLRLAGKNES